MIVNLQLNCSKCDAEITRESYHLSDEDIATVNVSEFTQTDWECPYCGTVNCIGDIVLTLHYRRKRVIN